MWDLSSLTRDGTTFPAVEALNPNHWITREVPTLYLQTTEKGHFSLLERKAFLRLSL